MQFDSPDIVIAYSKNMINEDAVIYSYRDSITHDYALKYDHEFVSLDGEFETKQWDVSRDSEIDIFDVIIITKMTVT